MLLGSPLGHQPDVLATTDAGGMPKDGSKPVENSASCAIWGWACLKSGMIIKDLLEPILPRALFFEGPSNEHKTHKRAEISRALFFGTNEAIGTIYYAPCDQFRF